MLLHLLRRRILEDCLIMMIVLFPKFGSMSCYNTKNSTSIGPSWGTFLFSDTAFSRRQWHVLVSWSNLEHETEAYDLHQVYSVAR